MTPDTAARRWIQARLAAAGLTNVYDALAPESATEPYLIVEFRRDEWDNSGIQSSPLMALNFDVHAVARHSSRTSVEGLIESAVSALRTRTGSALGSYWINGCYEVENLTEIDMVADISYVSEGRSLIVEVFRYAG